MTYSGLVDAIDGHDHSRFLVTSDRPGLRALRRLDPLRGGPAMRIGTRTWAAATVHHGIDTAAFAVHPDEMSIVLSAGSIPTRARRARSRSPVGPVGAWTSRIIQDEQYFHEAVEPHLDDRNVRYLGPVSAADRAEVLGSAHALLHLIDFDEPFGYSVVEAMACGTPVVAYRRGSMAKLIRHGVNGLLVDDVEGAVRAVDVVGDLDRSLIRSITVRQFDVAAMVERRSRPSLDHSGMTERAGQPSQSTRAAARSSPRSSCAKWPPGRNSWCGWPTAPGTRSMNS
ncbi:MAG: glycosyltransferase [Ilumatobacteraceae bacterium]